MQNQNEAVNGRLEDYALEDNTKLASEVIEELDKEEYRTDLGQYEIAEDGLVHDIPLLAEFEYEGQTVSTFSIREMNGRDEEAINRAEVRQNGAKLVNVLLERIVEELGPFRKKEMGAQRWGALIRACPGANLDYMLVQGRKISKGPVYHYTHTCPNCKTQIETEVSVDDYTLTPFSGVYEKHFEMPRKGYRDAKGVYHRSGTIRLSNGLDREMVFPVAKKNRTAGEIALLTRIVTFDDGTPVFSKGLSEMVVKDKDYLINEMNEMRFGLDPSIEMECPQCGYPIRGELGSTDFF